jgi:hypothetical protein
MRVDVHELSLQASTTCSKSSQSIDEHHAVSISTNASSSSKEMVEEIQIRSSQASQREDQTSRQTDGNGKRDHPWQSRAIQCGDLRQTRIGEGQVLWLSCFTCLRSNTRRYQSAQNQIDRFLCVCSFVTVKTSEENVVFTLQRQRTEKLNLTRIVRCHLHCKEQSSTFHR